MTDFIKIWLDDVRPPPDETWKVFQTAHDLIDWLRNSGRGRFNEVEVISLDHDLGPSESGTGYDVISFIEKVFLLDLWPGRPEVRIHTANPVARQRMQFALDNINKIRIMDGRHPVTLGM